MGLTENKRIQHIVNTSAAIAADDFDGRLAYDTTEQAIRIKAGGVAKYASMRGHTHTEYVQKTGDTMTGGLAAESFTATGSEKSASMQGVDTTGLIDSPLVLSGVDSSAGTLIRFDAPNSSTGRRISGIYHTESGIGFFWGNDAGTSILSGANLNPVTKAWAAFGLQAQGLASVGAPQRNVSVDSDGNLSVAPVYVTREMVIQALPITNAAPGVVTLGPSGSMRSFGFDGNTQTEELFYHIDLQHDYVSGTDVLLHVHWTPSTNGTGNVVFKFDYQWVNGGASWPAPSTATCPAVAAGGTAWADKRSEVTISGAGKSYGSRLVLRLYRDPTDPNDTYAADAVLSSIGVHYTADPMQVG